MKFMAPAKINLNLSIAGRRADGYHLLQSDMVFTTWGDEITITPSDEFTLTADGPYSNIFTADLLSTDRGASNLIIRAVYALIHNRNILPSIHVHVNKVIPAGAGLGGGSSNAAAVIHALNDYWKLNLSMDELCAVGLELGAELPACLHARPCRVTGIGDIIEPIDVSPMILLIVWPDAPLLTKDVFGVYESEVHEVNDLTDAAISLCPEIGDLISVLQSSKGCVRANMSGSGSACFGVFENINQAKAAQSQFKNAIVTTTVI